jgi:hypothetical protein
MLYFLIVPLFVIKEGIYLLKHPRTFSGLAALLWAVITGASGFLIYDWKHLEFVPIFHVVAIGVYYVVKGWR